MPTTRPWGASSAACWMERPRPVPDLQDVVAWLDVQQLDRPGVAPPVAVPPGHHDTGERAQGSGGVAELAEDPATKTAAAHEVLRSSARSWRATRRAFGGRGRAPGSRCRGAGRAARGSAA